MKKLLVLVVLDGLGLNPNEEGNSLRLAKKPTFDWMWANCPFTSLQASGIAVGLPWGEVGNSEVGHQNLGSGSVIYQNLPRISLSIKDESFFENECLKEVFAYVREKKTKLHVLGLLSDGGVHSHIEHALAVVEMAKREKVKELYFHVFTDGRDVADKTALGFLEQLEAKMKEAKRGEIATIQGRFFAMDRGNNWERTQKAYEAMVSGKGELIEDWQEKIRSYYKNGGKDEEMPPLIISKKDKPIAKIESGDGVIFFNYREDRARQITKTLIKDDFSEFQKEKLEGIKMVTMTEYEEDLPISVVFEPQLIERPLARVLAEKGVNQFHIAETEKYAHVTYFFNGGIEDELPGEERVLIPSLPVISYAEVPWMSAKEVTDKLIEKLESEKFEFAIVNYANPDMVGHTGNLEAAIKSVEFVDECLEKLTKKVLGMGGELLVTADHGNCELMIDPVTKRENREHTNFPVPLWYVANDFIKPQNKEEVETLMLNPTGILADISPTILEGLGIDLPGEMTGYSLWNDLRR